MTAKFKNLFTSGARKNNVILKKNIRAIKKTQQCKVIVNFY